MPLIYRDAMLAVAKETLPDDYYIDLCDAISGQYSRVETSDDWWRDRAPTMSEEVALGDDVQWQVLLDGFVYMEDAACLRAGSPWVRPWKCRPLLHGTPCPWPEVS